MKVRMSISEFIDVINGFTRYLDLNSYVGEARLENEKIEYYKILDSSYIDEPDKMISGEGIDKRAMVTFELSRAYKTFIKNVKTYANENTKPFDFSLHFLKQEQRLKEHKKEDFRASRYLNQTEIYSPMKIRNLRKEYNLTRSDLARFLGVSTKTIINWETAAIKPHGSAIRLMQMIELKPSILKEFPFLKKK